MSLFGARQRIIGVDSESALLRRGLQAPPLTCISYYDAGRRQGAVVDRHVGRQMLRDWLRDDEVKLVGHNLAFDTTVWAQEFPELKPLIFQKYDRGGFEDTLLNEQLVDIAEGHYRWEVDEETDEYIGKKKYGLGDLFPGMEKELYRTGFGPLRDVPVHLWDRGFYDYALLDAEKAAELYFRQQKRYGGPVVDAVPQARAGFALHLMSTWGMRTDEQAVFALKNQLERAVDQLRQELIQQQMVDPKTGSKVMQRIQQAVVWAASQGGFEVTLTKGGNDPDLSKRKPQVSTQSDILKVAARFVPALHTLVKYQEYTKLLTTYVPALLQGVAVPINAFFNTLVETGRTSCSRPNLQNLPRGKKDGDLAKLVRECFVPRPGHWFCSTDYDSLEIRTLAQVLSTLGLGQTLVREYQRDPNFDPHTRLAARMLGISYEDGLRLKAAKDPSLADRRQMSKAGNFGYPGGMGAPKMITYAFKSYGVELSLAASKQLKSFFLASIPEMKRFFDLNSKITAGGGLHGVGKIAQLFSGRVRGGLRFTDCCNGWFQGLAADGAKHALWEVTKACHLDSWSPLYGSRPVTFIHDEIIAEMPIGAAPEAAAEMEKIMCNSMRLFTPDVPITASPALMERWYKGADAVFDERRRLTVYRPKSKAA